MCLICVWGKKKKFSDTVKILKISKCCSLQSLTVEHKMPSVNAVNGHKRFQHHTYVSLRTNHEVLSRSL